MELDDFKKKDKQIRDFDTVVDNNINERIDNIIDLFRSYQKKQRKKVIYIVIVNFSLAAIYIANMASVKGITGLGYFIMGVGLFAAVPYFFLRYKTLSAATYSLPLKEFLNRAERKVSYFNFRDYIVVVPLLITIGTGGGLVFTGSLLKYTENSTILILIWVLFFMALCLFGFWAGKKDWQKEYGDIHRRIVEMKNNYTSDEDNLSTI